MRGKFLLFEFHRSIIKNFKIFAYTFNLVETIL